MGIDHTATMAIHIPMDTVTTDHTHTTGAITRTGGATIDVGTSFSKQKDADQTGHFVGCRKWYSEPAMPRRFIEEGDELSDEMHALVEKNWPWI
jgi:hypothetical protein